MRQALLDAGDTPWKKWIEMPALIETDRRVSKGGQIVISGVEREKMHSKGMEWHSKGMRSHRKSRGRYRLNSFDQGGLWAGPFEQRFEGSVRANVGDIWRTGIRVRGDSLCKNPEAGAQLGFQKKIQSSQSCWSRVSKRESSSKK